MSVPTWARTELMHVSSCARRDRVDALPTWTRRDSLDARAWLGKECNVDACLYLSNLVKSKLSNSIKYCLGVSGEGREISRMHITPRLCSTTLTYYSSKENQDVNPETAHIKVQTRKNVEKKRTFKKTWKSTWTFLFSCTNKIPLTMDERPTKMLTLRVPGDGTTPKVKVYHKESMSISEQKTWLSASVATLLHQKYRFKQHN